MYGININNGNNKLSYTLKIRFLSFYILVVYVPTFISIIEVLLVTIPILLTVAFVTIAERKTMASMQRRIGPNIVGYYGLLQAFADALKLLSKEILFPQKVFTLLFLFFHVHGLW